MLETPLTAEQRRTLELICDALLPPGDISWRGSVVDRAALLLQSLPSSYELKPLQRLLQLMETAPGGLLLAGRWARFSSLSRAEREDYLRRMARHRLSLVRGGFAALKRLTAVSYYAGADASGRNPLWPALGYSGPVAPPPDVPRTIHPLPVGRDTTLDCDIVIVGSGAGGGIAAAELTLAGHDVIVVEKGGYFDRRDFNQRELDMFRKLYLDAALSASQDQGVLLAAGSCLGGGTVVNYTTSFRTPDAVREEWASVSGLDLFLSDDFTRSLDAACELLQVNQDHNLPSTRDQIMSRGLRAMGWHVDPMPRNVRGCTQDEVCGYCGLGCVRGAKCSTLTTCLQDAHDRGARILVDATTQHVTVENGRATGISVHTAADHQVSIRARAVVVAAGALHSPALLLRSGLGRPVGENLRLHPVTGVWGTFDEEVRPWTGSLQALYSDQFADLDGGYGFRFETAPIHPSLMALAGAWESGEQLDEWMRRLSRSSVVGILLRDREGGRVRLNRAGLPAVHYRISSYDQRHIRRGVEAAARLLLAAGACEIHTAQYRPMSFKAGGNERLAYWLDRADRLGYGPNQALYISFHQMGTCRMGSDPETSVVNGRGETHAVKGLFVADGSLFPTASGVNPMISIAALAHYVAQHVKAML